MIPGSFRLSPTIHPVLTFKALLIDLDGTLVDSSGIILRVMEAWCRKHNLPLQRVLKASHGGRTEDTVARVAPHLCAKTEAAEIERLENTTLEGLQPIPGAPEFVRALMPYAWAVVTSSSAVAARLKLQACSMPLPNVLITAESVSHGKPRPDPFLRAALALNLCPAECLAFEDADNGVKAALSAGCYVVVVGNTCRIAHPNIIARIPSFENATFASASMLDLQGTRVHLHAADVSAPPYAPHA